MSTQQAEHRIGFPDDIAAESFEHAGLEMTLQDAACDLRAAHEEVEQYRKGALTLAAELEEVQAVAEAEGNAELARTAQDLKRSALAVTKRIEGQAQESE